jgi:hypothetical protein
MPDVKVPFGFETVVLTDFGDTHDFRTLKGYKAQVTLTGVVVFERYYQDQNRRIRFFEEKHGSSSRAQDKDAWLAARREWIKGSANDEEEAAVMVLNDFANRLALTLTWPDGA